MPESSPTSCGHNWRDFRIEDVINTDMFCGWCWREMLMQIQADEDIVEEVQAHQQSIGK
jgi:hypothetical protein